MFNDIFGNINEQLRFAEAKNGALLTVDLAVVFGISSLMGDHHADIASPVRAALIGVAAGCAIGAIVSLVSFLPELKAPKAPRKGAG